MNLIVCKDIFIKYLNSSNLKSKNKQILKLIEAFECEDNLFVLTKKMIERIEIQINNNPKLLYDFQSFIEDLGRSKRYISAKSDYEIEHDEICDLFTTQNHDNYTFIVVENNNKNLELIDKNVCVWNMISKPNKDWIILSLVSNNTLTVRYSDFSNDKEIITFFSNFFKLNYREKKIVIFDSYCNYNYNTLFTPICNKGKKIEVYTSAYNKKQDEVNRNRTEIKSFFGKQNTSVKFSTDKKLIHERTIIHDVFLLETNHDFSELKKQNKNWKVDLTYDIDAINNSLQKCDNYN
ncbi:hypothetical protein [Flavobacterium columnare]|uniref:hypothetical protein n=1 Tax=Flavobacterium columnare TaxID=996 RepID=UPI0040347482